MPQETRASLILRLPDQADAVAWDEFAQIYGPLVYRIARKRGLQPSDADDLVQEVFTSVAKSVDKWLERSDRGSFRAWLLRIARNTAVNFLTRRKYRTLAPGGNRDGVTLAEQADGGRTEEDVFQEEYEREVFRWAAERVRRLVNQKTWDAFWMTTMEERSVQDVADQLGMTAGSVYIARSRIMSRLKEMATKFTTRATDLASEEDAL